MRTLMSLALVVLVAPAPLGAAQAPGAQPKPAAPAAKPAEPAPAQSKPAAQPPASTAKPAPAAAAPSTAKPNPGQPAAAPVEAPAPPPPPSAALASESYTYDPSGRRDPFENLTGVRNVGPRPTNIDGIAGLSVNEISIRGVITSRNGGYIAMVQGPNNKTYSVHAGDRFFDGLVRAVNAEGLVIVQEVNDPLSLVKQREVSKKLRSLEAKE